jgi:hypothetical protein
MTLYIRLLRDQMAIQLNYIRPNFFGLCQEGLIRSKQILILSSLLREKIRSVFLKGHFTAVGIVVLVIGLLFIAGVWTLGVSFTQSLCEGGEGPVPNQGCGYVPYLVLFVWGENTTLIEGILLALLGSAVLLLRLFLLGLRLSIGTFLTLGILMLVVSATVGSVYASSEIYSQSEPLSGTQYLQQCPVSWPVQIPGPNTTQLETLVALTINPNTVAKICTEYNSANDFSVNVTLTGSAYFANNMTKVPTPLIQINAEPKSLKAPGLAGTSTGEPYAVFTLNVSSSDQGFYMLSLSGICPLFPLDVGYVQINYSDFAYGWRHQNQCSTDGLIAGYVSVNNVGAAYSYVPLNDQ